MPQLGHFLAWSTLVAVAGVVWWPALVLVLGLALVVLFPAPRLRRRLGLLAFGAGFRWRRCRRPAAWLAGRLL